MTDTLFIANNQCILHFLERIILQSNIFNIEKYCIKSKNDEKYRDTLPEYSRWKHRFSSICTVKCRCDWQNPTLKNSISASFPMLSVKGRLPLFSLFFGFLSGLQLFRDHRFFLRFRLLSYMNLSLFLQIMMLVSVKEGEIYFFTKLF